ILNRDHLVDRIGVDFVLHFPASETRKGHSSLPGRALHSAEHTGLDVPGPDRSPVGAQSVAEEAVGMGMLPLHVWYYHRWYLTEAFLFYLLKNGYRNRF